MPHFRYAVDENAPSALLVLSDSEIATLMPVFESVTEDPLAAVDFYILNSRGRRLPNKIAGEFVVTYWFDRNTSTVFILRINRIQPDSA
jgi:hypothetical protein